MSIMLSVVRLAPARGVIVNVKTLGDWTKVIMRTLTIMIIMLVKKAKVPNTRWIFFPNLALII